MQPYLELVQTIFEQGSWQENRTGVRTLSLPGAMLRFDLQHGFPAVTTKKLAFNAAMAELTGFLRGYRNAADFRALGCKVWDQNANLNNHWLSNPSRLGQDDLGAIYGVQWRQWPAYKLIDLDQPGGPALCAEAIRQGYRDLGLVEHGGPDGSPRGLLFYKAIDQLKYCLDTIMANPSDRRILFHAWNPAQLDEMALPPCHLLYQFLVNAAQGEISLCLYVRSNDIGLGAPFNIAEGAALLHLVGRLTGYRPRWFSYFIGDAHIYENHLDMLKEQLSRAPLPLPKLVIDPRIPEYAQTGLYEPEWLENIEPGDFKLENYRHHDPLTAPMAV